MLKVCSLFRKLGKKSEEKKLHMEDSSLISKTIYKINIWSLKIQL